MEVLLMSHFPAKTIKKLLGVSSQDLHIETLSGGLTNRNFKVTVNKACFVVRISGENVKILGIDRKNEEKAIKIAESIGIMPDVFHFDSISGNMVTRFVKNIRDLSPPHSKRTIHRISNTLHQIHSLPKINSVFSPLLTVNKYVSEIRARKSNLPQIFDNLLETMLKYDAELASDRPTLCFCHNDLNAGNLLDDGRIRILDWEYAGMNDPHFDLASIALNFKYHSKDIETLLYFYHGKTDLYLRKRIKKLMFMVRMFGLAWDFVQQSISDLEIDFARRFSQRLASGAREIDGF
jgi:thiamine kinase-like enzyme